VLKWDNRGEQSVLHNDMAMVVAVGVAPRPLASCALDRRDRRTLAADDQRDKLNVSCFDQRHRYVAL
jgi:hypothetical protein